MSAATPEQVRTPQRTEANSKKPLSPVACLVSAFKSLDHPLLTISALVLILALKSMLYIALASFMKSGVDAMIMQDGTGFRRSMLVFLAVSLLAGAQAWAGINVRMRAVESLIASQRRRMLDCLVAMPLVKYERLARGDLVSRLTADVNESSRLITSTYLTLDVFFGVVTAAIYCLYLSWEVGLAVLASCIIVMVVTASANSRVPTRSEAFQKALGDLSTYTLNSLEGITVVKSFSAQETVAKSLYDLANRILNQGISLAKGMALRWVANSGATILPVGASFVYGGYMAMAGRLSVGGVSAMYMLSHNLSQLVLLGRRWLDVQRSAGAFRRVQELLDSPRDLVPAPPASQPGEGLTAVSRPPIQVKGLSFRYEAGRPVLDSISLEVPTGAKVAIMGKSGCGKSTLLKLLAGLYAPDPGTVFVNGLDMHYQRLSSGRKQATYIPQEPFLSSGTVRDNLTLSSRSASLDDIAGALQSADSTAFVEELPDRLDAQVGERGSLLSGGQRQRLCVARGLLRGAPIVLLDEPTSSLDAESERRIAGALLRTGDLTCVIVTHRFEIAERCDLILVMQGGRIVESGTHEALLQNHALYWSLHSGESSISASPSAEAGRGCR